MCLDCACGRPDPPAGRLPLPHRHPEALAAQPASIAAVTVEPPAPAAAAVATASLQSLSVGLRLLAHNDRQAEANRARFAAAGVRVVNILSAPGSGKTALLEALARHAAATAQPLAMAVLVGDLATELDAERLRAAGLAAVPITTGQACHLEAAMVARGIDALEAEGHGLAGLDLLLIENVGNLVCPAAYDLGEDLRLVLLSVSEGEDKPLKYPATFHGADGVVISKSDLAEAVGFARDQTLANIRVVAPAARVVEVSARSGAGLEALLQLLR